MSGAMGGGQSSQLVRSPVYGLGNGLSNRTDLSHMATSLAAVVLLAVAEVSLAAVIAPSSFYSHQSLSTFQAAIPQEISPFWHYESANEIAKDNYPSYSEFSFLRVLENVSESTKMELGCKYEFSCKNCYKGDPWHPPDGLVQIILLLLYFTWVRGDVSQSIYTHCTIYEYQII